MKMDRYLGPVESQIAATNLKLINSEYERLYHEECPAGLIDITELGDRYLSPLETQRLAINLNSIYRSSNNSDLRFVNFISAVMAIWVIINILGGVLVWLNIL